MSPVIGEFILMWTTRLAIQHQENPSNLTSKDFYIKGEVSLGNLEIIYVG